ncbi:MAG: hypothetical protein R3176_05495 [Woeseiaceae bacterium]|nr:hypothetical protein [Woeseiaceae bacterium]
MNRKAFLGPLVVATLVAACDSGDINLSPTNIDNSNQGNTSTNPPPAAANPCARYEDAGQTFEGALDGNGNCVYDTSFVSDSRPITVSSIRFPNFGGLHIFEDSLFIGRDVSETSAAAGVRVPQEGEGTRLIIDAGNTMVFTAPDSYVRIARGSQIFAEGTADAPIVFTADEDAILGAGDESARGLWGGLQINGNGITNKCHDGTATGNLQDAGIPSQFLPTPDSVNPHNCHAEAEGRPAAYGGNNNAENSGVLTYVVVKHAGFEVVDGDELNAITLNGVGSGTTISHVQVYTTLDDGFEMFGGAVNLDHIVAVNVGDDSIDYSEGYTGDIQYAVVLHTSGANRCIEGDNTGGGRDDGITPRTKLRISNMTCITSNIDENGGVNPSSKGSSEGPLFREGAWFEMYNSIVTSNETVMTSNECLELDDSEGPETIDGAQSFDSLASSNVIACTEALKTGADAANAGFDLAAWLATAPNADNIVEATNLPFASLITDGVGARGYLTAPDIQDSTGAAVFDQATQLTPVGDELGGIFDNPAYLGGASAADDWLAGWTVGFDAPLSP